MVFTGTFEHTIDPKNRLAIPSDVRAQLRRQSKAGDDETLAMYVMLGDGGTLCLYSESGFEKRAEQLDESELDDDELFEYEQLMFGLARRVELDKQGRIRLPDNLLKMSKLPSEVVLVGVRDHIKVRDRGPWLEYVEKTLADNPQMMMNPRRAMRKRNKRAGAGE